MNAALATRVIATPEQLDEWILEIIGRIDVMLRGHCQHEDCFESADTSEVRTSLSFCSWHYYKRMCQRNRDVMTDYALSVHRHGE